MQATSQPTSTTTESQPSAEKIEKTTKPDKKVKKEEPVVTIHVEGAKVISDSASNNQTSDKAMKEKNNKVPWKMMKTSWRMENHTKS